MNRPSFIYFLGIPLLFLAIMWGAFLLDEHYSLYLAQYSVFPRRWENITGILVMPFVHGGINHIVNNSIPFLVLSAGLFFFYRKIALKVFLMIILFGGLGVWINSRPSFHIGASGLIYGLFSFLFFSGILRKEKKVLAVSLAAAFWYGSFFWGILPTPPETHISWEGHFWGFAIGATLAYAYRNKGPQEKKYYWEEEEEEYEHNYWEIDREEQKREEPNDEVNITYIFRPKKKEDS